MISQKVINNELYPSHVRKILQKIVNDDYHLCLLGFSKTMKWLARIFSELEMNFDLFDWRDKFLNYDCCGHTVEPMQSIFHNKNPLIVICPDDINIIKNIIKILVKSELLHLPAIFEYEKDCNPSEYEIPYMQIIENARERSKSEVSNDRLFNLVQLIRETRNISGDIVEFGTFSGGTAAIIVEVLQHLDAKKNIWLFDTFSGFPECHLGVDFRWKDSFSNVSFAEVRDKFSDCSNVKVINGDIHQVISCVEFPISFAHVDIDSYETAELVTSKVWPLLNKGGIILFDDYGFFPNCLPLTVFVDDFVKQHPYAFSFFLPSKGFFIIKQD